MGIDRQSGRRTASDHSLFLQNRAILLGDSNADLSEAASLRLARKAFKLAEAAIDDVATQAPTGYEMEDFYHTAAYLVDEAFAAGAEDPVFRLTRFSALQDTLKADGDTLVTNTVIPRIQQRLPDMLRHLLSSRWWQGGSCFLSLDRMLDIFDTLHSMYCQVVHEELLHALESFPPTSLDMELKESPARADLRVRTNTHVADIDRASRMISSLIYTV